MGYLAEKSVPAVGYADSTGDGALIEVAQVKGLDMPDLQDITRLQGARFRQSKQSNVPLEWTSYWNQDNNDDFVILRTQLVKGSRINIWLKFIFGVFKWHVRDMKQVSSRKALVSVLISS